MRSIFPRCASLFLCGRKANKSSVTNRILRPLKMAALAGGDRCEQVFTASAVVLEWWSLELESVGADDEKVRGYQIVQQYVKFMDDLAVMCLIANESDKLRAACCTFLGGVCGTSERLPLVIAPSPALCYRLLLGQTATGVDGLCRVLLDYRVAIGSGKGEAGGVALFNAFVWDVCNLLWSCKDIFSEGANRGNSILFGELQPEVFQELAFLRRDNGVMVESCLSIVFSPCWRGYAEEFVRLRSEAEGTKEQKGEDSQEQSSGGLNEEGGEESQERNVVLDVSGIRGGLKVEYLEYLKSRGFEGVYEFLNTFIKSLVKLKRREREKAGTATEAARGTARDGVDEG